MMGSVVIRDPNVCQGQFTISGHSITVETLTKRWMEGESIALLSSDYSLEPARVERVLRWAAHAGQPFWDKP